jgi:hypothetical protein
MIPKFLSGIKKFFMDFSERNMNAIKYFIDIYIYLCIIFILSNKFIYERPELLLIFLSGFKIGYFTYICVNHGLIFFSNGEFCFCLHSSSTFITKPLPSISFTEIFHSIVSETLNVPNVSLSRAKNDTPFVVKQWLLYQVRIMSLVVNE